MPGFRARRRDRATDAGGAPSPPTGARDAELKREKKRLAREARERGSTDAALAAAAAQAAAAAAEGDDVEMVGAGRSSRMLGVKAKLMKKSGGGASGRASASASAAAAAAGGRKKKRKPVKLRKGTVVKGIKIKDAESKRLAMEALRAAREDGGAGMDFS